MSEQERIINFDDPRERIRVASGIQRMRGQWRIVLKKYRKGRSNKQNAYLWAVVYPAVREGLFDAWGERMTDDEVHLYLRAKFLAKPIVNRETGEQVDTRPGRTSTLDTVGFADYLDQITKFAGEYLGVEIPAPDPEYWRKDAA